MSANSLGLSFSAANEAAVAAFDRAIDEYLAFGRETGRHLKEALAADPEMVMAHVLRGYFFQLMALPALLARALLVERCVLRPHNPEAWRLYADVLGQLGDAGPAARAQATSGALAAR